MGGKLSWLAAGVLAWLALGACAPAAPAPPAKPASAEKGAPAAAKPTEKPAEAKKAVSPLEELIQKAKAEGRVTLEAASDPDEIVPALEVFEKQFAIKVEYRHATGVETRQRQMAEIQAGRDLGLDAIDPGAEFVNDYLDMKVMVAPPYAFKAVFPAIADDQLWPSGWGVSIANVADGIAYHKKLVGSAIPKTWEDCTDPRWGGGQVVIDTRLSLYPYAWLQPEWFYPWVTRVKNNGARLTRGLTEPLQNLVVTGEAALHCGNHTNTVNTVAKNAPDILGLMLPDPLGVRPYRHVFVYSKAKNPHAAQLIIGWLATDGHKLMDDLAPGRGFPWIPGTWLNKNAAGLKLLVCDARCNLATAEMQSKYQEALGLPAGRR